MKIVNQTTRAASSEIQTTPITALNESDELVDGSYIHVAEKVPGTSQWTSKKILLDTFKEKLYQSVQNTLKTQYWDTHEWDYENSRASSSHDQTERIGGVDNKRLSGTSFKDMIAYLEAKQRGTTKYIYVPTEVDADDPNGFVNHIYFDFDVIKNYIVLKNNDITFKIGKINEELDAIGSHFAPNMSFFTRKENNNGDVQVVQDQSVNHGQAENDAYCQMSIEVGNKISSEWLCPETGMLVVYGWLDSSACLNNKATPGAFCVLEGKINTEWEIIAVQPVTPAKNITYVGFTVPVRKDLVIRARTGFECGAKSGQYPNEQDGYDTLANSTPNGFKCMIYTKKKGTN